VRQRRPGEVIADGTRVISDLVRWGMTIRDLYVAADVQPGDRVMAAAQRSWTVERSVFETIAPTRHPQGMLAVVDEPPEIGWRPREGTAVLVEGVQDPGNVGAIVRSVAALGGDAALLAEGCADPYHPLSVRASAGAVFCVPIQRGVGVADACRRVRENGGQAWATGTAGTEIDRWLPGRPILLLVGGEGAGLSTEAVDSADGVVTIPMDRRLDSLNVAVAAGILLHHLARRR